MVTSYTATPTDARALANAGLPRLLAVTALAGVALGFGIWLTSDTVAIAIVAGLLCAVVLPVTVVAKTRQAQTRAFSAVLFPGAQWSVEYFPDRFTLRNPIVTTTIGYRNISAVAVKPGYVTLSTTAGTRMVLPSALVPPAALGYFPVRRG
ncbi:hypothetical protein BKN37_06945 [Mycobacterium talmoniae]|uniref:Uncharacterized protein n=1 Tax=Mycobacterium talmoniae TaxID=1858794 RepID=A0A1S1NM96_9MYCO|nr:hypothetical protein BKN37_06945 [Mycobacterium talmoniae]